MTEFAQTEQRVLRNPQSLRNIETIARSFGLTRDDLIAVIAGKTIVDVGSGTNGLAIDVVLRNVDCVVYSVDPHIAESDFEQRQRLSLSEDRNKLFTEFDPQEMERARVKSLSRAYPFFAHNMPSFADGQFDLLIDHYAVFGYFQEESELPAFLKTIDEERRILSAGSPMYIADFIPYGGDPSTWDNWKEWQLIKLGLKYHPTPVQFSIITYNQVKS